MTTGAPRSRIRSRQSQLAVLMANDRQPANSLLLMLTSRGTDLRAAIRLTLGALRRRAAAAPEELAVKGIKTPGQPRQDDPKIERAIEDHRKTIDKVAAQPGVGLAVLPDVVLLDGIATPVPHKMGKAPSAVSITAVRGQLTAGVVEDVRSASGFDRGKFITLKASGYGATITVDVLVVP